MSAETEDRKASTKRLNRRSSLKEIVEKILKYKDWEMMPRKQKGEGFLEEREEKELSGGASMRL